MWSSDQQISFNTYIDICNKYIPLGRICRTVGHPWAPGLCSEGSGPRSRRTWRRLFGLSFGRLRGQIRIPRIRLRPSSGLCAHHLLTFRARFNHFKVKFGYFFLCWATFRCRRLEFAALTAIPLAAKRVLFPTCALSPGSFAWRTGTRIGRSIPAGF